MWKIQILTKTKPLRSNLSLVFFVSFLILTKLSPAQDAVKRYKNYNLQNGVALHGYDPVSYYSNKPLKGKAENKFNYKGVSYLFATTGNLGVFKKEPEILKEALKQAYEIRKFEIELYWKRATYFWTFIGAALLIGGNSMGNIVL